MIAWGAQTIFGANIGFEYIPRLEFEKIDHPAEWSLMINLFFFRIMISKYPQE